MKEHFLSVIRTPGTTPLRAVILLAVALGRGWLFGQGHTLWQVWRSSVVRT